MFLAGCGGSGKSRVIIAVVDFARRWHMSDSILVTATTGSAATGVGGFTYNSATAIRRQKPGKKLPPVSSANITAWQPISMVIIDEISMMSAKQLAVVNERLQRLKEDSNTFGGVHLIFSGDLYQLAAIGGAMYEDPAAREAKKRVTADDYVGYNLWKDELNSCVMLESSERQKDDPPFAALLMRYPTHPALHMPAL
jgi:hypothetical protein